MTGSAEDSPLPPLLATQVALIRDQLAGEGQDAPDAVRRFVDAAVLNLCEHVDVDMGLLNRVLGLRAAVEGFAQSMEDPDIDAEGRAAALQRARDDLAALEQALVQARPSPITIALGLGW